MEDSFWAAIHPHFLEVTKPAQSTAELISGSFASIQAGTNFGTNLLAALVPICFIDCKPPATVASSSAALPVLPRAATKPVLILAGPIIGSSASMPVATSFGIKASAAPAQKNFA